MLEKKIVGRESEKNGAHAKYGSGVFVIENKFMGRENKNNGASFS